jgi:hypothetical protein
MFKFYKDQTLEFLKLFDMWGLCCSLKISVQNCKAWENNTVTLYIYTEIIMLVVNMIKEQYEYL